MRTLVLAFSVLASITGIFFGCSASSKDSRFNDGEGGSGAGSASGSTSGLGSSGFAGGFTTSSGSGSSGGVPGCSQAATYVYVLSTDNEMYKFDPPNKQFTKIGKLGCATSMQPNSMAVDRNAVAYVNYVQSDPVFGGDTDGAIFQVSTTDASCKSTSINLTQGWYRLGMGYSAPAADLSLENLFVTGTSDPLGGQSPGLGKVDFGTNSVVQIGDFTGALAGKNAELTGTGDGRLFGFFTTTPVQVAEINPATGSIIQAKSYAQVQTPSAWAFSFWGGAFYLYTADPLSNPGEQTTVTKIVWPDGPVETYMTDIGFVIVGAGVSTCAPVEEPK